MLDDARAVGGFVVLGMVGQNERKDMGQDVKRKKKKAAMVVVVDPNYHVNDGVYTLPMAVTAGMQIGLGDKYVVVGETMVIRGKRHFEQLWRMWGKGKTT